MAEPETTPAAVDTLRKLQMHALETDSGSGLAGFERNADTFVKAHLEKEGYDVKHNTVEAALRAWQHRHGLHAQGFGPDGKPDLVTQAMILEEMKGEKPDLAKLQTTVLGSLTTLASSPEAKGADKLFEKAGLASAAPAVSPVVTPVIVEAPAAATVTPAVEAAPVVAGPSTGEVIQGKLAEGADAAKRAGASALEAAGNAGTAIKDGAGRVGDAISNKFEELGGRKPTQADLDATGAAISQRASELRQTAADAAAATGTFLSDGFGKLKDGLHKLTAPDAAASGATATPVAPEVKGGAKPLTNNTGGFKPSTPQ